MFCAVVGSLLDQLNLPDPAALRKVYSYPRIVVSGIIYAPHRILAVADAISHTAIFSAKQRKISSRDQEFPIDMKVPEIPGGGLMRSGRSLLLKNGPIRLTPFAQSSAKTIT